MSKFIIDLVLQVWDQSCVGAGAGEVLKLVRSRGLVLTLCGVVLTYLEVILTSDRTFAVLRCE